MFDSRSKGDCSEQLSVLGRRIEEVSAEGKEVRDGT